MAVAIAGTNLKKMTFDGQAVKKWVHDGVQVFSAEEIVVPNPADYPKSVYNVSLLNSGGTLTVDATGAKVQTTSTAYRATHVACLPIDVSEYTTLTYEAFSSYNDGNYRTTLGFSTTIPTASQLDGTFANIKQISNNWDAPTSFTGTIDVSEYSTIYAIFGQGYTRAAGNYGHGTTGFTSIVLT